MNIQFILDGNKNAAYQQKRFFRGESQEIPKKKKIVKKEKSSSSDHKPKKTKQVKSLSKKKSSKAKKEERSSSPDPKSKKTKQNKSSSKKKSPDPKSKKKSSKAKNKETSLASKQKKQDSSSSSYAKNKKKSSKQEEKYIKKVEKITTKPKIDDAKVKEILQSLKNYTYTTSELNEKGIYDILEAAANNNKTTLEEIIYWHPPNYNNPPVYEVGGILDFGGRTTHWSPAKLTAKNRQYYAKTRGKDNAVMIQFSPGVTLPILNHNTGEGRNVLILPMKAKINAIFEADGVVFVDVMPYLGEKVIDTSDSFRRARIKHLFETQEYYMDRIENDDEGLYDFFIDELKKEKYITKGDLYQTGEGNFQTVPKEPLKVGDMYKNTHTFPTYFTYIKPIDSQLNVMQDQVVFSINKGEILPAIPSPKDKDIILVVSVSFVVEKVYTKKELHFTI